MYKNSAQKLKSPHQKKRRSAFRILTALFVWGTFFIAHTVECSTVNKQQLPELERGAAFIFKYQVVISESESQVRLFCPFPTLPDVDINRVHALLLESNHELSRMKYRVEQARCNIIMFYGSHIPITQQMVKMYKYMKQEVNETHFELNILSDVTVSFLPPESSPGTVRRRRSIDEEEPHN